VDLDVQRSLMPFHMGTLEELDQPFEREEMGNADWHHQETGFGSWLWIYQGRGRTGILLPPEWHRRRLRRPPGWREGSVRNRVEPQGPARQERPRSLRFENQKRPERKLGPFLLRGM